jgi:hypothetical protein
MVVTGVFARTPGLKPGAVDEGVYISSEGVGESAEVPALLRASRRRIITFTGAVPRMGPAMTLPELLEAAAGVEAPP